MLRIVGCSGMVLWQKVAADFLPGVNGKRGDLTPNRGYFTQQMT